jgi:hypothetical protein
MRLADGLALAMPRSANRFTRTVAERSHLTAGGTFRNGTGRWLLLSEPRASPLDQDAGE